MTVIEQNGYPAFFVEIQFDNGGSGPGSGTNLAFWLNEFVGVVTDGVTGTIPQKLGLGPSGRENVALSYYDGGTVDMLYTPLVDAVVTYLKSVNWQTYFGEFWTADSPTITVTRYSEASTDVTPA